MRSLTHPSPRHQKEIEYEWLYKDAPISKSGKCMAMCAYASQPRLRPTTMTLSVGDYFPYNPIRWLWMGSDYVDRTKPFTLIAEFSPDMMWSLKLGFRRLGEFLAVLDYERIPAEEWQDFVVRLPTKPLPYDTKSPSPIRQNAFTNIRRLQWTGHRRQLRESWIPFTASILQSVNTLDITCDLSLQDCTYILFHSTSLKELKIKIHRELAHEPALWFDASGSRVERCLESLTLTSDDDIGPLFESFNFPSLHHVELEPKYPTLGTFDSLDIWANIRTGFLDTYMTEEDADWIRKQLPVGSQFKFKYSPGVYGAPYRYLDNEATEWTQF